MNRTRVQLILSLSIVSLAILAAVLIAVFVFRSVAISVWHQTAPIGYNIFSPDVVDENTVRYYTGNTFAQLNTATGARTPLTKLYSLPNLSQIHWLKNGVVFQSNTADDFTDLGDFVANRQQGIDETALEKVQPTYWYLSFKDNSLKTLDTIAFALPETSILTTKEGDILFRTDDTHFARLSSDGTITYDIFTVQGDTRPVYATANELYYVVTNAATNVTDLRKIDTQGKDSTLFGNLYNQSEGTITSPIVSVDGTRYYYEFLKGEEQKSIRQLDLSKTQVSTVVDDFQGTITHDKDTVVVSTLRNDVTELTVFADRKDGYSVRFPASGNRLATLPVAHMVGKNIFYTTSNGEGTIVSQNTSSVSAARNEALEKRLSTKETYVFSRNIEDTSDASYSLTIPSGYYHPVVDTFKQDLEKAGISPYEIKLTLSPGMQALATPTN